MKYALMLLTIMLGSTGLSFANTDYFCAAEYEWGNEFITGSTNDVFNQPTGTAFSGSGITYKNVHFDFESTVFSVDLGARHVDGSVTLEGKCDDDIFDSQTTFTRFGSQNYRCKISIEQTLFSKVYLDVFLTLVTRGSRYHDYIASLSPSEQNRHRETYGPLVKEPDYFQVSLNLVINNTRYLSTSSKTLEEKRYENSTDIKYGTSNECKVAE